LYDLLLTLTYFIRDGFQISMFKAKATDLQIQSHRSLFEAKVKASDQEQPQV